MGILIAVVLVTALASTIVSQSENARGESMKDRLPGTGAAALADNTASAPQAAPIFAMYPLFWAIVGLAVVAAAVIGYTKAY